MLKSEMIQKLKDLEIAIRELQDTGRFSPESNVFWVCGNLTREHVDNLKQIIETLRSSPPEPAQVVITLEGGLVQGVLSDGQKVEALIVDYDTEDADLDEITYTPDGDQIGPEACIHRETAEINPERVKEFFECYEESLPNPASEK